MNRFYLNGDGFFTTLLRWHEQFCALPGHFSRLKAQSEIFGLDLPFSSSEGLKSWLYEREIPDTAAVRILVSAAETDRLYLRKGTESEVTVELRPVNPDLEVLRNRGISLSVSRLNYQIPLPEFPELKWSHYQPWAIIRNHDPAGYDTVIRNENRLLETTTAALIGVDRDGSLVLNSHTGEVLESVILTLVSEFSEKNGKKIRFSHLLMSDLDSFSGYFYANSTHGLIPVTKINSAGKDWNFRIDPDFAENFWDFYIGMPS
ncbi:MAG: aminotransferase class IV [Bacteroidetes bacterium]|nr:aminotransferase class IV [Bacteroidota bacterium]